MGAGWIELGTGQGRGGPEAGRRSASRAPDTLTVTCSLRRLSDLTGLLPTIRFVADLDTDLDAVGRHLGRDGALACRLRVHGPSRLPGTFDRFELAVRAVVGQQVSVKAARTLLGRLVELAGTSPGGFPTPDALASGDVVAQLGMPQRRRATIAALARAFADERVVLAPHTDPAAARRQLLAITGVGPWTAGYITMRALGDPDGWPVGDLGLRRSLDVTAGELETRAERWRPWRAYAAMLLWRSDPTIERAGGPSPARRPRRPPPASAQTPAPAPTSTEGVTT
jgi:AraC family transcriptional regulator of adaptative response / DNA-3-methyladenine glycosylase II